MRAQKQSGTRRTGRSWVSEGAQAAGDEGAAPQGSQPAQAVTVLGTASLPLTLILSRSI